MLVVADSSPIIVLVKIAQIDLLPALFETIVIPPTIIQELLGSTRPASVRALAQNRPRWLVEQVPSVIEAIPKLDSGERAAISLAREISADYLLMDETKGRHAAIQRNLRVIGTVGILEAAAARGFVDLAAAFHAVKQTDFWIPHEFLDNRLRHFQSQARQKDSP